MILWILLAIGFVGGQLLTISVSSVIRVSFLDLAVLMLVGTWLVRHSEKKALQNYVYLFGPFIGVVILGLLISLLKLSPEEVVLSSLYAVRFIIYSLLFCVGSTYAKKIHPLYVLWIGGFSLSLIGLAQYFLYPNLRNLSYLGWDPHQYRIFSTLLDPNFLGIILVLTLILSAHLLQHKNTPLRNFVIVASGLCFMSLLLTYSRGSYVAFVVILTIWTIRRRKFLVLVFTHLVFVGILFLLPKPGGEGVDLLRFMSVQSRLLNNNEAWNLFLRSPVIGHGFDTLPFVRQFNDMALINRSAAGFHNSYLFILATTGLFGFIAYLWLWKQILSRSTGLLGEIMRYSILAVGIHALFDNSLFYPWVMVWLWLLAGVVTTSKG
jgi:O-antigen ligase